MRLLTKQTLTHILIAMLLLISCLAFPLTTEAARAADPTPTVDTRFTWQHLSHGFLQVNWYNRPQDFGQFMLSQASASVARISHVLGGGLKQPTNIWIYETDEDFHGSLGPQAYEWVGGQAQPSLHEASIVVVSTTDDTLVRDMPHELTHLIFHQLVASNVSVPTWFDEGLAVYNQSFHEPAMTQHLQQALATHSLLPFQTISSSFPSATEKAYLAYAQSWNMVDYLYGTFGSAKMAQLIKKMGNAQADFGQDLIQTLGEDQPSLENQWRTHLNQPPLLSPGQSRSMVQTQPSTSDSLASLLIALGIFLILAPIVGIALLLKRANRQIA